MFIVGIHREPENAGKPEADRAIAELTASELKKIGFEVKMLEADDEIPANCDAVFSMVRAENDLEKLENLEKNGKKIINSPLAVKNTLNREIAYSLARKAGAAIPNYQNADIREIKNLNGKKVLKRPDGHDFTRIISSESELSAALGECKAKGITRVLILDFVDGEHIKFYGIGNDVYIPDAKGISAQVLERMKNDASNAAQALGLKVYGGDFIAGKEGAFLIDMNDWPSFSPMRGQAAKEIAKLIAKECEGR